MVSMGLVAVRRTGAGVSRFSKIIDGLMEAVCKGFCTVAFLEPPPVCRNIESRPVMEYSGGRIRIVADKKEAPRALWDTVPREWWRDVFTIAGILSWDVTSLSKGGAR